MQREGAAPGGAGGCAAGPADRAPPRARPRPVSGRESELGEQVRGLVDEEAALLGAEDREALVARIAPRQVGLGPLEDLLADPTVEEVMVNGPHRVYVERDGRIEAIEVGFADEEELRNAIERILAPLGRRVDELSPMVDARLADGSRVNVVIPPLAIDGPALSIRRFGASRPGPRELVELGTLDESQRESARAGCPRAAQPPRQRRHRLRQDDPAQRALELRRRGRAGGDDRGRRRAAAAAAAMWCAWRAGRRGSRGGAR